MKRVLLMIVVLAAGALVPTAHASLAISLDDPSTITVPLVIVDQGPGDQNPLVGVVKYDGAIDTTWLVNVTTSISKPIIGSVTDPKLDLNSVNVTSVTGGDIVIMATDTDYSWGGPTGTLVSSIGGTTDGTVTFTQILDLGNEMFATSGDLSVSLGPFSPIGFSGSGTDSGSVSGDFSLTEIVGITHTAGGQITSFDALSHVVPVPGAVLLGILGLGVAGLKLRKYA